MTIRLSLVFIVLVLMWAPASSFAQEEKKESINNTPVVDEFSLVMRNLLKRAQVEPKDVSKGPSVSGLKNKVDDIQALLTRSDEQVANASRLKSKSMVQQSDSLEKAEVSKFQDKLAAERERQMGQLLITKAKIAFAKKAITNEKQRQAVEKADKAVQAALKLIEGTKE